jgi:hypothetical protein
MLQRWAARALLAAWVLLAAVFFASGRWYLGRSTPTLSWWLGAGGLAITRCDRPPPQLAPAMNFPPKWTLARHDSVFDEWWFTHHYGVGMHRWAVPIWPFALALAAAWWFTRPRSKRSGTTCAGACPSCGYDLRGLQAGSSCPECGAT